MFKKIIYTLIFILTGFAISAQVFNPGFTDSIAKAEQQYFRLKSEFVEKQNYSSYDLIYQRMEWNVDPAVKYISGSVTSYFISLADSLSEIEFDLNSAMTVDSVLQNKTKRPFTLNANVLSVQIEKTLKLNETDSLTVYYRGEPEKESSSGFGSFSVSQHQGVPVLWTLSEPYGAMEWWPCKQSLADKIDSIDVIVTCPQQYRTAGNGILVSETLEKGKRKMHWKHRYPVATYLVAIAVTNYVDYSDTVSFDDGREMNVVNFVYPEYLDKAKNETAITPELIRFYGEIIGEYPFAAEKYGHAQFGWGGGMEHQTMSFMGSLNFDLQAHELAHQWFGDYITLGTWQDIWLNEGFATYMTGLSYEHFFNGSYWPIWKKATLDRILRAPDGSVFVKDTTDLGTLFSSRLSYSKGAYLLHMLRWVLGDENFFEGMRNYFNDPAVANGFARNEQFVKHMEAAGDTTLTEFFNDWYYGEGYPVYSARYAQTGDKLTISLAQETSHPSVEFFEMPVPVRVYSKNRADSMDFRLSHLTDNQEFQVNVPFKTAELVIDPERWLISKTSLIVKTKPGFEINDLVIFPNPFRNEITVFIPQGEKLVSAKIYNSSGVEIRAFEGNQTRLNCSGLAPGTYFLRVNTDRKTLDRKIIKLKN